MTFRTQVYVIVADSYNKGLNITYVLYVTCVSITFRRGRSSMSGLEKSYQIVKWFVIISPNELIQ